MAKEISIVDDLSEGRRKKQIKKGIEEILRPFLDGDALPLSFEKINERLRTDTGGAP